jgi:DNA-binding transcriptional LysR family regulator
VDLTLTGLRVVVAVSRTGSFSAAADELGYTQSAVSRQVAATELAAGGLLFERRPRGVVPTAAGEVLVRHAAGVLDRMGAAEQELAGLRDRLAGTLVLGGFPTAAFALLPRAIARLRREHPGVRVELLEGPTPRQLQAVRRGRSEVAVVATGDGLPDYDLDGLRLEPLEVRRGSGVAVADDHPLAVRAWLTPADLADQPWVVGAGEGPEFGPWPTVAEPTIAYAARDWVTRLGLVAAGLGMAVLPGFAAEAVPRGVRWIPVRDDAPGPRRAMWTATTPEPGASATAAVTAIRAVLDPT